MAICLRLVLDVIQIRLVTGIPISQPKILQTKHCRYPLTALSTYNVKSNVNFSHTNIEPDISAPTQNRDAIDMLTPSPSGYRRRFIG